MWPLTGPDWDGFRKMIFDEEDHHLSFAAHIFFPEAIPEGTYSIWVAKWKIVRRWFSVTFSETNINLTNNILSKGKLDGLEWACPASIAEPCVCMYGKGGKCLIYDTGLYGHNNTGSSESSPQTHSTFFLSHLMMQWPHSKDLAFVFNIKREREQQLCQVQL